MPLKTAALATIAAAALFAGPSIAEERPTVQSWTVAFTSKTAKDTATARLIGGLDQGGVVLVTIHDAKGRLVYDHSWPAHWFANPWTKDFGGVGNIPPEGLYLRVDGDAADLPADLEERNGFLKADQETYDRARAAGGNLVCYVIGYEASTCAWYDLRSEYGVELSGWGA